MSKLLNFAGVSRVAGELKFRTATEPSRFQQLTKLGDTDVEMTKITPALSKQAAAQELLSRNFANGRADIEALLKSVASKKVGEVTVKVPTRFAQERQGKKVTVSKKRLSVADRLFGEGPTLSIEEANARALSTMREITPERALQLLVRAMPKKRRSRKTQAEVA
jgi:hypothetical protein